MEFGHLEQSCFLKENYSITDGMPPEVNLRNEKNNGENILKLIKNELILSSHDVSNGGLIVALSEMAMSSNYGVKIQKPKKLTNLFKYFFFNRSMLSMKMVRFPCHQQVSISFSVTAYGQRPPQFQRIFV